MSDPLPPDARSSRAIVAWVFDRLQAARAFHLATRFFLLAAGVLVVALAYLWIVGVPSRATRLLLQRLESDRLEISVERMWIDPLEGLKARHLRLIPRDAATAGPLTAAEVNIDINWLNILAGGPWLDAMSIQGGGLTLRLPSEFGTNGLPCDFVVSNVTARARSTWNMFRLEKITAQWPGGTIEGHGILAGAPSKSRPGSGSLLDDWLHIQGSLSRSPAWARELYQHLSAIHPAEPIRLRFAFNHHPEAPELQVIRLDAEGGSAICQGVRIDGWAFTSSISTGLLVAPRIELRAEGRTCRLDGTMNLTNRLVELHAVNELPPSHWRDLLPSAWLADLGRRPLRFGGSLRSEIWIPATPLAEFGERWRGTMTWDSARYREVTFENGRVELERDGDLFRATGFEARASRDNHSGPIACSIAIDLASGSVSGALRTAMHPDLFSPWIPLGTQRFLQRIQVGQDAPSFAGTFAAGGTSNGHFQFEGLLTGSNFSYRNTAVASLDTGIAYSNGFLTLEPFHLVRTHGEVRGGLWLDLAASRYRFDLHSTIDPVSIGRFVSSNLEHAIAIGRYEGPAQIHAHGVYDEKHPGRTEISVDVAGQQLGLRWFLPEEATFTLRNEGLHYAATNIFAKAYGTEIRGRIFVYPDEQTPRQERFEIDLQAPNVDFRELVIARRPDQKEPPGGHISLRVQVAGHFGAGLAESLKGEGTIAITNSQLSRVPLLGGLSVLLAKIYPDFGYAAQNELFMDFEIRDGVLSSSNIRIGGTVLSAKAKGTYDIAKDELDFIVEAQLLRKGTVADALRFITMPVTKLFQFELKGSLEKPEWRTANLPRIF